jgi:hypothetical protein
MIDRIRADKTIDEVYSGYAAAKYGKSCAENLFRRRGSFTLKSEKPPYTEEDLRKAQEVLKNNREKNLTK